MARLCYQILAETPKQSYKAFVQIVACSPEVRLDCHVHASLVKFYSYSFVMADSIAVTCSSRVMCMISMAVCFLSRMQP